ncbi:MAG: AsmA-like C-terminal region-containing protein [Halieaceae bacterium]|jgi:uncharacterized protein (TIGR02099 family)|nr:AsmA-like C-terminal region-containing protein [Halieaceae bacterium]
MAERLHRWVGAVLWRAALAIVIVLAVYVSGSRVLLSAMPRWSPWLVQTLEQRVGGDIEVGRLNGRLNTFSPEFELIDLSITLPNRDGPLLSVGGATLRLDIWSSLLAMAPRFDTVVLERPTIDWYLTQGGSSEVAVSGASMNNFSELVSAFRRINISDGRLLMTRVAGDGTETTIPLRAQIDLSRAGSERRVRARLESDEGLLVTLAGRGIGNPFDASASRGELHGTVQAGDIGVIGQMFDMAAEGSANLHFWYQPVDGDPHWRVTGVLDAFSMRFEDHTYRLDHAAITGAAERRGQRWQFDLQDSLIKQNNAQLRLPRVQVIQDTAAWRIGLNELSVGDAVALMDTSGAVPQPLRDTLSTLAPTGNVEWLQAILSTDADLQQGWSLQAAVRDATTQPLKGVPGLGGVDAWLEASPEGAMAWIDTESFLLDLPRVYAEPITFDRVVGRLAARWQSDALFLEQGLITASIDDHAVKVQFAMDIPLADSFASPLTMDLTVGLPAADVSVRQRYIPTLLKPSLYDWLARAIPQGQLTDTTFIWRGDLLHWDDPDQTMQLALALDAASLSFDPIWPEVQDLSAYLLMDDADISVWSSSARMLSAHAGQTSVELRAGRSAVDTRVASQIDAGLGGVLALLRQIPVTEAADGLLNDLEGEGRVRATLGLAMDVKNIADSLALSVQSDINSGSLRSELLDLSVTDINGGLDYSLAEGFSGRDLSASTLGVPLGIEIDPALGESAKDTLFAGRFSATVPVEALADWLAPPVELPWSGVVPLQVDVLTGEQTSVGVYSDLVGTGLELPTPIGKSSESKTRFMAEFLIAEDAPIDLFWEGRANAQLYRQGGVVMGGTVDLTPTEHPQMPPEPPISGGYYLRGNLESLDVEAWLSALRSITLPEGLGETRWDVGIESMQIDQVSLGDTSLGPFTLDLTPFANWEMLGINAEWLDAELTLRHDEKPSALIINQLNLDRLPDFTDQSRGQITPPDLTAPIDVVIANLQRDGKLLGAASFSLASNGQQLDVTRLQGRLANVFFEADSSLQWSTVNSAHETRVNLDARLGDVGDTLDQLSSPRILETRRGTLQADLTWADTPIALDITTMNGSIDMLLREGSFLPVPNQATGALRILSLLNLAGLVQRANINQLFEPGVTFDRASGRIELDQGMLNIPGFAIDGSGGTFLFDSAIDLIGETIDGELVVTLPLAKNIPWVAALAGGLPIAAGAYILSRVFEDQVAQLSSGVYSVTGDLAKPDVKFERIFDAKSQQSRIREQTTTANQ